MPPPPDDDSEAPERTQAWATEEVDQVELERAIRESDRLRKAVRGDTPSESARARKPTRRDPAVAAEPSVAEQDVAESESVEPSAAEPSAAESDSVDPGALTTELPPSSDPGPRLSREQTREFVRRRTLGLNPGAILGKRFRLDEEIGRGAQGIIYRARDLALAREVAIKLLRTDAPGQARERFEREAKTISRLRHPGIVTVYETGAAGDGTLYYAMELISGRSMEDLLDEEGYLEPERLVKILEAVARAIHHAHDAGLIHRDLKPGNLLLDAEEERPRIADFGLVSLGDATRLTMTRGVVGTPVYMAPEQAEGARVDRRADVYSLGAILYEGLVGQPPFTGVTPLEIFRKVVEEDPVPPREIRAEVPALIERVCLRALEKEPRARYPTAAAFGRDLRRALDGERLAPEAPVRLLRRRLRRRRNRVPILLAVALVGSLAGLLAGWLLGRGTVPGARLPLSPQLGALPDPGRAAKRERVLEAARAERARCLPQAALAWLGTLTEERAQDPLASRDAGRAEALATLCHMDLGQADAASISVQAAERLAPDEPLTRVALAAIMGPEGLGRLQLALRDEPGLVEGWLAVASLSADPLERLRALDQAVGLSEPRPWPLALRERARVLLELSRVRDACEDVGRLLERVGAREGFEVERALSLWVDDPGRAVELLEAQQGGPQAVAVALALEALPAPPRRVREVDVVGARLQAVERRQVTKRLVLTAGGQQTERTEVEVMLARYTDQVLETKGGRAVRLERVYDELRLSTAGAVWVTDLTVQFGEGGLETALGDGIDPRIRSLIAREGLRFARWGLAPARPPDDQKWDLPAGLLAATFGVSPGDLAADAPRARGRLVERSSDTVTVELVGALRLSRYQGLPCAQPATGVVRSTLTYQEGQERPAKVVLEGSYAGQAGWSWAGVSLAFEVGVEGETVIRAQE